MKRNSPFILTATLSAILALSGAPALAQTPVGGEILIDTTWTIGGSPYIVEADVTVRAEATLTIEPGVEVRFDLGNRLQLGDDQGSVTEKGTLIAIGDPNDPNGRILFTSNNDPPAPGDWESIWFANNAGDAEFDDNDEYVGGGIIQHATVEYAGGYGAVYITYSAPFVKDVVVRDCAGSGVHVDSNGTTPGVRIEVCHVSNCSASSGGGIHVWAGSEHRVRWNTVEYCDADNGGGGLWISSDSCLITNNTVRNNEADYGGGMVIVGEYNEMSWNSTHHNTARGFAGGLYIRDAHYLDMFWEWVQDNTAAYGGGGIDIGDSDDCVMSNCNIRYNQVVDNAVGGIYVDNCARLSLAGDPNDFFNWSNNIVGNDGYQLRGNYDYAPDPNGSEYDIDATYVLWCTSDPSGLIYDYEDDQDFAVVHWVDVAPFLGDLDGNGVVNLSDLAQLLAHYGLSEGQEYEDGDLDLDGDVDLSDLASLISQYGDVCD